MSNSLVKKEPPVVFGYEITIGDAPTGLGYLTDNPGFIIVGGICLSIFGMSVGGWFLGLIAAGASINDLVFVMRSQGGAPRPYVSDEDAPDFGDARAYQPGVNTRLGAVTVGALSGGDVPVAYQVPREAQQVPQQPRGDWERQFREESPNIPSEQLRERPSVHLSSTRGVSEPLKGTSEHRGQTAPSSPGAVLQSPTPASGVESRVNRQRRTSALEVMEASPYFSTAFFGAQRTGKSYFVAILTQRLAKQGIKIFHINLASYTDPVHGNEDDKYWGHATSVRTDLDFVETDEAAEWVLKAAQIVEDFKHYPGGAILVVDEIANIGSNTNQHANLLDPLLKKISSQISGLASSGDKRSKAIYTLAPEFIAGDLSQEAKAVKKLRLCYVTIPEGKRLEWKPGRTAAFSEELFDAIRRNYPLSRPELADPGTAGEQRIAFLDREWRPLGLEGLTLNPPGFPSAPMGASAGAPEPAPLATTPTDLTRGSLSNPFEAQILDRVSISDSSEKFQRVLKSLSPNADPRCRRFVQWLGQRVGARVSPDEIRSSCKWLSNSGDPRFPQDHRNLAAVEKYLSWSAGLNLVKADSHNTWLIF